MRVVYVAIGRFALGGGVCRDVVFPAAVFPAAIFPAAIFAAGLNGGAGIDEDFQRRPHRVALLYGKGFQHRQDAADPRFTSLAHHFFAPGGELQAADAAIVSFRHALYQPRPLQAIGDLGQSA